MSFINFLTYFWIKQKVNISTSKCDQLEFQTLHVVQVSDKFEVLFNNRVSVSVSTSCNLQVVWETLRDVELDVYIPHAVVEVKEPKFRQALRYRPCVQHV